MAPKTERQKLSVHIGPQLGNLDLGGPSERNFSGSPTKYGNEELYWPHVEMKNAWEQTLWRQPPAPAEASSAEGAITVETSRRSPERAPEKDSPRRPRRPEHPAPLGSPRRR